METRLTRSQSCGLLSWRAPGSRHGSRLQTSQSTHRLSTSPRLAPPATAPTSPRTLNRPPATKERGVRGKGGEGDGGRGALAPGSPSSRAVHLPFVAVPLPVPFFIKKGLKLGRRLGSSSSSTSSSSGEAPVITMTTKDAVLARRNATFVHLHTRNNHHNNNANKRMRKKHEDGQPMPPIR